MEADANMKSLTCFKISFAFPFSKGLTDPEHRFIKRLSLSMEVSDIPQKIANTSFVLSFHVYKKYKRYFLLVADTQQIAPKSHISK